MKKKARILKGSSAEARAYALKLLSYRSRSRKEMLERLKRKGFAKVQINSTITFLEDTGLINDETLASTLFSHSVERKSLGKQGINLLLAKRGINRELIDKTLAAHTEEMEKKAALEFVGKKMNTLKNYPEDVVKRRLWGMLRRRGFSTDVIKRVIDAIM